MEAFKLPIIGTLFCYAKNGIEFFETPVAKFFLKSPKLGVVTKDNLLFKLSFFFF